MASPSAALAGDLGVFDGRVSDTKPAAIACGIRGGSVTASTESPMAVWGRRIAIAASIGLGLLLLNDATSNTYMPIDRARGRMSPACFTVIENLVGVTKPSAIRPTELLMGLGMTVGVPIAAWRRRRGRRS